MPVAQRIASLREVGERAIASGDFSFPLRDFLDGFYASQNPAAFADEPPRLAGVIAHGENRDAYLGAVAEHLCREHRWAVPPWSRAPFRYLEMPSFAMTSHGGRMVLLEESPAAFRVRNIFVSANALSRA